MKPTTNTEAVHYLNDAIAQCEFDITHLKQQCRQLLGLDITAEDVRASARGLATPAMHKRVQQYLNAPADYATLEKYQQRIAHLEATVLGDLNMMTFKFR